MQIRARVLLEQTEAIKLYFSLCCHYLGRTCWFERLPPKVQGFTVRVAMQIHERALLKKTDYFAMTVSGETLLV